MAAKRPTPKPTPPSITDEWGIYDPAKAGMPALFARLGRPVLTAAPTSARRERRRALRPERSGEGVGLAIAEARKRAGLLDDEEHPGVGGNPARAIRMALRAQTGVDVAAAPDLTALDPPPPPVAVAPPVEAPSPKKRPARKSAQARAIDAAAGAAPLAEEPPTEPAVTRGRTRRAPARGRARASAAAESSPAAASAALPPEPSPPAVAVSARPAVPAPSPRRPRGPVPLAAWAHAVVEPPKTEPRRADNRGLWRGLFRIPTEVALVEYAHGAKIHRLIIEAGDDLLPDFI